MTKITVNPDCNNATKKKLLRDFNIAFATGDAAFIIGQVSEDIVWEIIGDKTINGKEYFAQEINAMKANVADEITLHSIITHGREAAVNGEIKMKDSIYAFCDVYKFKTAGSDIIKELNSYVIKTRE